MKKDMFSRYAEQDDEGKAAMVAEATERALSDDMDDIVTLNAQPPIMTEDEFMDRFEPRDSPEGSMLWERDQVLPLIDSGEIEDRNVWTAVDAEGGIAYVAGWHAVNVFAYVVTKVKWDNPLETVEMQDESEEW